MVKVLRTKPELCTECYKCEEICSTNFTKSINKELSAIKIGARSQDTGLVSIVACDQCGNCIEVCPVQAIYRAKNGTVLIRKSECVGCYSCVGFCPAGAMQKHLSMDEPYKCIACGKCAKECPARALYIEEI
ncbi:Fe-S-cluster-containing hydrogenase component 2 [Desulfotomaculum arcticum]|uniref:Fe-S-cluster-containing hydrogenase component 2 n=1 Tax=Desulfotruncus arcticus DSM 17038 TaxID=1121424 RepID=A0A1I2WPV2_9FIRM|nr:4Fe-4S binding protein [Desulfotruncus arcticus]SFH02717.1 Fe-S-cluster-containing hydrogenase component 2 [Desulfotomaculum arcticum] [Desulfotruncus arcticus DSM 17038]